MRAGDLGEELHYFIVYLETEETFEVVSLMTGTGQYAVELIEKEKKTHQRSGRHRWGVSFSPAFVSIRDLEHYLKYRCKSEDEYERELADLRAFPNYPREEGK